MPGTNGRLLQIGGERNANLGIPDNQIVRFPINLDKPLAFMDDIVTYLKRLHLAAKDAEDNPNHINRLAIDGFSEMCYVFVWGAKRTMSSSDTWAVWDAWREKFMEIIMLLDPEDLQAHVLGTARVQEVKKSKPADKVGTPTDPD